MGLVALPFVLGLGLCWGASQVAFTELAFEEFQRQAVGFQRQFGIVAMALVAEEGMLAVELMPGEMQSGLLHRGVDCPPAFERHMRILRPQIISISAWMSPHEASVSSAMPLPRLCLCKSVA